MTGVPADGRRDAWRRHVVAARAELVEGGREPGEKNGRTSFADARCLRSKGRPVPSLRASYVDAPLPGNESRHCYPLRSTPASERRTLCNLIRLVLINDGQERFRFHVPRSSTPRYRDAGLA